MSDRPLPLLRNKLTMVGSGLSVLLVLLAVFSPWIAPLDPLDQSFLNANQGPTGEHWFGTDAFGRDVLSRVLFGGRVSLAI